MMMSILRFGKALRVASTMVVPKSGEAAVSAAAALEL
jgi:hypothetical protein